MVLLGKIRCFKCKKGTDFLKAVKDFDQPLCFKCWFNKYKKVNNEKNNSKRIIN